MKKTTDATKKVRSIEHAVKKNNVRFDIIGQTLQWIANKEKTNHPIEHIHSATLPADKGYFENALHHSLNTNPFLTNRPSISFDCAEKVKTIAIKAMRALPENSYVLNGSYKDLFKKNLVRKAGGAFTGVGKVTKPNTVNFAWADYCCPANMELTNDFVDMVINNIESGLAYVTFCGHSRGAGGRKTIAKKFAKYATDKDSSLALQINNGVIEAIIAKLKKSNKKVELVYNVIYGGGQHGNTTMMTIGFAVNLPKHSITLIEDYRQGQSDNYGKVYRMSTVLSGMRGWKIKDRKKHGRRKGRKGYKLSPERIAELHNIKKAKDNTRRKIAKRYAKGMDSKTIAKELGLSTMQVGSIIAWLNPNGKLAKKKVNA